MQIADRLYHVASQCCEKDCLPSKAGAYIFGHGTVTGLRHRSAPLLKVMRLRMISKFKACNHCNGQPEDFPNRLSLCFNRTRLLLSFEVSVSLPCLSASDLVPASSDHQTLVFSNLGNDIGFQEGAGAQPSSFFSARGASSSIS